MKSMLILVIVAISCVALTSAACSGRSSRSCDGSESLDENCMECTSSCDCESENCNTCSASNSKCCQNCCGKRQCSGSRCESSRSCDCRNMNCNKCSVATSECCDTCCSCKSKKCSSSQLSQQCGGCQDVNCGSSCQGGCCNSCCNKDERRDPIIFPNNTAPNINLPNITVIINQSPIYVNTTPIVNNYQSCGNYSSVNNGSHIVYISSNASSPGCGNRTCCRVPIQRPCPRIPYPPYIVCPPPQPSWRCGPACDNNFPPPSPCFPGGCPPQQPVVPIPPIPSVQGCIGPGCGGGGCTGPGCGGGGCIGPGCGGGGCVGAGCGGCVRIPTWPFYQCGSGTGGTNWGAYGTGGPVALSQSAIQPEPADALYSDSSAGYPAAPMYSAPAGNVGDYFPSGSHGGGYSPSGSYGGGYSPYGSYGGGYSPYGGYGGGYGDTNQPDYSQNVGYGGGGNVQYPPIYAPYFSRRQGYGTGA